MCKAFRVKQVLRLDVYLSCEHELGDLVRLDCTLKNRCLYRKKVHTPSRIKYKQNTIKLSILRNVVNHIYKI